MKEKIIAIGMGLLTCLACQAQDGAHLRKLTEGLVQLRKAKASNDALNKTVLNWSASGNPKITLMDDLELTTGNDNEYKGNDANKFKVNQVVTYVYGRQNTGMVSKGEFFNSMEKDIYYSVIEKNIKKKSTVSYSLIGHVGTQEFVFVSFNPRTRFSAAVNGKPALPVPKIEGVLSLKLPKVKEDEKLVISITNDSDSNESFVIFNHNPQK